MNGQQNGIGNWWWLAGAVGTAAGIAAYAYSRKPRTPWQKACDNVVQFAGDTRKQMKPWITTAAGVAATCAAEAYRMRKLYPRIKMMKRMFA